MIKLDSSHQEVINRASIKGSLKRVSGADLDCRTSRTGDSQNFRFDF